MTEISDEMRKEATCPSCGAEPPHGLTVADEAGLYFLACQSCGYDNRLAEPGSIKEMLDRLSDLNEGELSDLESKIIAEFETVEKQDPTAQVVDSMTALADALDAVRGEQQNRT